MAPDLPPKPPDKLNESNNPSNNQNPESNTNSDKQNLREKKYYNSKDSGPYEIYIQHKEKNVGNYNLLSIAKEIFQLKLKDILAINKKGKNRIGVIFNNYVAANSFISDKVLEDKGYESFIPSHLLTCKGIIRSIDKNMSEEEIKKFSNAKFCEILSVKRLNRKVIENNSEATNNIVTSYKPTGTVCLTFSGKILPKEIDIFGLPMKVIPYVNPVLQCQNCLLFGHSTNACRSKKKCINCSKIHDIGLNCIPQCLFCKTNDHLSNDKNCPEFKRQKEIKSLMSFSNLSYFEANQQIPRMKNNDYAYKNDQFPELTPNKEDNTAIHQRKVEAIRARQAPSYSQITMTPSQISKRKRQEPKGYDREEYNTHLLRPNGRNQDYASQPNPTTSRQYEERNIHFDFDRAFHFLSQTHKETVMTFIGNLISNFYHRPVLDEAQNLRGFCSQMSYQNRKSNASQNQGDIMECSDDSELF